MKRKLNWKMAVAATLMGLVSFAPVKSDAQTSSSMGGNVINRPILNGWRWSNWNSGYYYGPQTTSYYDARYGWVKKEMYADGSVRYYTFGYQVVYVWTNGGYTETIYQGNYGVAYPVVYGPRP